MMDASQFNEDEFQQGIRATDWYAAFQQRYGEAPDLDTKDYDYRKAWAAGLRPTPSQHDDGFPHWPSSLSSGEMLKSEDHPTAWKEHFMRQYGIDPDELKPGRKPAPPSLMDAAQALQKQGRGKDRLLAHITPGEARLLKKRGGSGTINPKTGLLEFDVGDEATGSESWDDAYGDDFGDTGSDDGMESPGMGPGNYGARGDGPPDDGGRSIDGELGPGPYAYQEKDMGFLGSLGRSIGNSILGFVGLNNPGPEYYSQGIKSSPGYEFNPGALAGSYLGLATGMPGMGMMGAAGWNAFKDRGEDPTMVATADPTVTTAMNDPLNVALMDDPLSPIGDPTMPPPSLMDPGIQSLASLAAPANEPYSFVRYQG